MNKHDKYSDEELNIKHEKFLKVLSNFPALGMPKAMIELSAEIHERQQIKNENHRYNLELLADAARNLIAVTYCICRPFCSKEDERETCVICLLRIAVKELDENLKHQRQK